jgi:hypothetical protein
VLLFKGVRLEASQRTVSRYRALFLRFTRIDAEYGVCNDPPGNGDSSISSGGVIVIFRFFVAVCWGLELSLTVIPNVAFAAA